MKTLRAALVVLAGAALAAPAAAQDSIGVVTAVNGTATLSRGALAAQPVKFRDRLQWRDVIETHKDSSARALLLGKTSITVRELSRVELREEALAGGRKQTLEVLAGKVRAIVERSLMDKGEQVEVRSPNAVAAVRGTDFVVDVIPPPSRAQAFGMLAALEGGPLVAQAAANVTTLVYTISGVVDVTNGATERITAFQGARVRGTAPPERFQFARVDLPNITRGLTVPPPPPARTPPASDATVARVERTALDRPLRGGAGTVERPNVQQLVVPQTPAVTGGVGPIAPAPGIRGGDVRGGGPVGASPRAVTLPPVQGSVISDRLNRSDVKNIVRDLRQPDTLDQLKSVHETNINSQTKSRLRERVSGKAEPGVVNKLKDAPIQSTADLERIADSLDRLDAGTLDRIKGRVSDADIDKISSPDLKAKIRKKLRP